MVQIDTPHQPPLWIGGSMHTAHALRQVGAEAIHDDQITVEHVKGRHCIIAPSGVSPDPDAAAERYARRALQLGAQSAAIIRSRSLNGAADVADWLELKNGPDPAVDLNTLADKAQPISTAPAAAPLEQHLVTDEANAKRIAEHFKDDLAYTAAGWHVWDWSRWALDDDLALGKFSELGSIILKEAAELSVRAAEQDGPARKHFAGLAESLVKFSLQSENLGRIKASMVLAQPKLKKPIEAFDADPFLLNCRNGIVDLRTAALVAHHKGFMQTKIAGCAYDPEAKCPTWEDFLADIFMYDLELVCFVQRLVGYFLTGSTREHVLIILHGIGGNGKTTFLRILMAVLGEYARPAPAGLFEARRDSRDDQHIALLWQLRLVAGHETERGSMLRESFIKLVTGDDRLSGRRLYSEPFDFNPTHKLVLATNHRPRVAGTDEGIWRRLLLVPFNARFSKEAGNLDPMMREKLEAEAEGILAWAVRGCIEWQRQGLNPPAIVQSATDEYRKNEDIVAQFVEECCTVDPRDEEPSGTVYKAYSEWCEAAGVRALRQRGLAEQLKRLGVEPRKGTGGKRNLAGIRLSGASSGGSGVSNLFPKSPA